MNNPVNIINELLEMISNPRAREVVLRRFGLRDGKRQTLEAIGRDYGITRERVRQIEESGLSVLRQGKVIGRLEPVFGDIAQHLSEHGDLKKEDRLYADLSYVCFPASEFEYLQKEQESLDLARCKAAFYLILTLGANFTHLPENDYFHSIWTTNKNSVKAAKKTVDSLVKHLETKKSVLKDAEIFDFLKSASPGLSDKAAKSYVAVSKHIRQNQLGHFGLMHWPEISPRGVKDKAYIVLKHSGKPLHFCDVTSSINDIFPEGRCAYLQTVHNELIKDQRFVLVGRGLYALAEWGYEPGTVSEIIKDVIQSNGGALAKEEIVKRVMEKRLVKENTVLINLQNRSLFDKDEQGRYSLKI